MANWNLEAVAGAPGSSLLWRGTWSSALSYNPNDAVFASNGSSYVSKTNNQNKDPISNPSDWDMIASVGSPGTPGSPGTAGPPGQTWRGTWVSTTSYVVNDAVEYQGSTFICTGASLNEPPVPGTASNWVPPLATTGNRGSVAALPSSNQIDYYARGDNTWALFPYPRGYLNGLTLVNNIADSVNDIDVLPGVCRDDTDTYNIKLTTTLTKRLDAVWAAGTNQGGLDTGTIANTTYHIFSIKNPATGAVDVLFSTSLSPTMPSGFTAKRRLGSIPRHTTFFGGIEQVRQLGDYFQIYTACQDVNDGQSTGGIQAYLINSVPAGLKFYVDFKVWGYTTGTACQIRFYDPDQADGSITLGCTGANVIACTAISMWLNNGRTMNVAVPSNPSGVVHFSVWTFGWRDSRGTDGYG